MQELTKEQARIISREKLNAMTDVERVNQSDIIVKKIISSELLSSGKSILFYKAMPKEVNIDRLIAHCIQQAMQVYLPRVNGNVLDIVLYDGQVSAGAYGIQEPIGDSVDVDVDIAIIPLLAIDKSLTRLGRGKGYYDKFLVNSKAKKIAVAFSQQLMSCLPKDSHDISMDICFTDDNIFKIQYEAQYENNFR